MHKNVQIYRRLAVPFILAYLLLCTFTWMCSIFKDIHAKDAGYSVIAQTFENGTGY